MDWSVDTGKDEALWGLRQAMTEYAAGQYRLKDWQSFDVVVKWALRFDKAVERLYEQIGEVGDGETQEDDPARF